MDAADCVRAFNMDAAIKSARRAPRADGNAARRTVGGVVTDVAPCHNCVAVVGERKFLGREGGRRRRQHVATARVRRLLLCERHVTRCEGDRRERLDICMLRG